MSAHCAQMLQRNDIEWRLVHIWEEVLGIRAIGAEDSFFALGGTSLLATFMFARVAESFNIALSLSTLIQAPTIAQLASIIRDGAVVPTFSPLVAIQPRGSRPPFFCVHGAGGNVLMYRDLSRRLGPDQPFYGLQSQGLDGKQPILASIEEMASSYLSEIQRVQPHGPYYLGGYCMGGAIALEIAQQLIARGEQVALLALFDTVNWSKGRADSIWSKTYYQGERLVFHARNFSLLNFRDKVKFLKEKTKVLQGRFDVWGGTLQRRLTGTKQIARSEASVLAQVWETNDSAALNYIPRRFPGTITDFRPIKQYKRYAGEHLKWSDLAQGGQRIVTLPVYPAGMLLEPFVEDLATELLRAINRAAGQNNMLGGTLIVGTSEEPLRA